MQHSQMNADPNPKALGVKSVFQLAQIIPKMRIPIQIQQSKECPLRLQIHICNPDEESLY